MTKKTDDVLFGAYSLQPGIGGIARVARLMARVLIEEMYAGRLKLRGLTLGDQEAPPDLCLPLSLAKGSKFRFSLKAFMAGLSCRHFVYDACHLSQVHRLPLL